MIKVDSLKSILEKESLSFIFACACVVIMPIDVRYIPPFMILWGLSRILEYINNRYSNESANAQAIWLFILFVVYYFWQLIGIIYSDNIRTGWDIFLSRLSLFLFPFVLTIPGKKVLRDIKLILNLFAISTTVFILFCFSYSLYRSVVFLNGAYIFNSHPPEAHWLSYFYGSYFSVNQHPSYTAMYVILSAFIALESWFNENLRIAVRAIWLVISIFLIVSIYFLSSRSGIICILFLGPIYIFYKLNTKAKKKGIVIGIFILIFSSAIFTLIHSNERVKSGLDSISNGSLKQTAIHDGRILIWKSALKIIRNNLIFGVGIGDVKTELMKEYIKSGNQDLIEKRYNAHNQFLEVLLEDGIIGLFFLVVMIGFMLRTTFIKKNILYGIFLTIIIVFFMFETVLYRLAGVSFFSLFSFLLIHLNSVSSNSYD
jgi:O-antigen ligase